MKLGRPMKGRSRRHPITIQAPDAIVQAIDDFLEKYNEDRGRAFSRSDFYNEAVVDFMRKQGVSVSEEDAGPRLEDSSRE